MSLTFLHYLYEYYILTSCTMSGSTSSSSSNCSSATISDVSLPAPPLSLTFGVEVECVVAYEAGIFGTGPKDVKIRREIEELLDRNDIPMNELRGDDPIIYEKWTINEDATIELPRNTAEREYEDAEFQSRIFYYDDPHSFEEIRTVLRLAHNNFDLMTRPENCCGLHVHIGNEDRGFPFAVLRRYVLFVMAFEHLLLSLTPESRLTPPHGKKCFCHLPSTLIAFRGMTLAQRLEEVRACNREWQLQELMCPIWYGKNTAFNIGSHSDNTKRTLEHRLFAGTTDAEEIVAYVELCAGIVSFVWHTSDEDLEVLLQSAFNGSYGLDNVFSAIGKPSLWQFLKGRVMQKHSVGSEPAKLERTSPEEVIPEPCPAEIPALGSESHPKDAQTASLTLKDNNGRGETENEGARQGWSRFGDFGAHCIEGQGACHATESGLRDAVCNLMGE